MRIYGNLDGTEVIAYTETTPMQIVWDERKRRLNIAKHGYDFAELTEDFFLDASVATAKAGRLMAIGRLESGLLAVIFATLGREGVSVISMRPANRSERKQYVAKTAPRAD